MISLITGLPGNGKTLYALTWLRERAAKEGRQVYYSGIKDLLIPGWIEIENPEQWASVPKNSIVVVDEAQRIFRPRMHGTKVPDFVAALETHRHLGVDLVFITQHPMLVDSNVRRLVGQHFHVIRKFGTHWATIHEWGKVKETCDKNRDDSVRHEWRYPKEVFGLYKSAEVHTHKRRIPFKVIVLLSMPLIIGALVWWAWTRIDPHRNAENMGANLSGVTATGGAPISGRNGPITPEQYVAQFEPRVSGLAYTAPIYDQVTQPVEAPYPAACIRMGSRCTCYTQQGTVLIVSADMCGQIVERGFFVAWKLPERPQAPQPARPDAQAVAATVAAPGPSFVRPPVRELQGGTVPRFQRAASAPL
jgi:zona occludens toxin